MSYTEKTFKETHLIKIDREGHCEINYKKQTIYHDERKISFSQ